MALSDLIARLEEEAQSRVQAIERDADVEVRNIEAATDRAVAEIGGHYRDAERAERDAMRQRELALARREARTRELEARHAQLARILDRAGALIPSVAAAPAYADALSSHLDEALSFLEGTQPRVRCQRAFADLLQAAIARHHGARLVVDESVGPGFIAEASDGAVIVDNTLAARLARAEGRLHIDLLKELGVAGR